MPLEDLDLEFEDDDESHGPKEEILNDAEDIEFTTPNIRPRSFRIPLHGAQRIYEDLIKEELEKKVLNENGLRKPKADQFSSENESNKSFNELSQDEGSEPKLSNESNTHDVRVNDEIHLDQNRPSVENKKENFSKTDQIFLPKEAKKMVSDPWFQEEFIKIQIESKAAIQFAEFKASFLTNVHSDLKLIRYQLDQLLKVINDFQNMSSSDFSSAELSAKNESIKGEAEKLKNLVLDFLASQKD